MSIDTRVNLISNLTINAVSDGVSKSIHDYHEKVSIGLRDDDKLKHDISSVCQRHLKPLSEAMSENIREIGERIPEPASRNYSRVYKILIFASLTGASIALIRSKMWLVALMILIAFPVIS